MITDLTLLANIAYLLLVSGFVLGMFAIFSPGTGLLEVSALFSFVLAGWLIINNRLPVQWWALVLLILGVFPFLIALRFNKKKYLLAVSILALVIGSAFFFDAPGWQPAVNPWLALIVSTLVVLFFWIATTKTLQAEAQPHRHNIDALIGQIGEAKTDILEEGSVQVAGELWSAQSQELIPAGSHVRVIERSGLILTVEAIQPEHHENPTVEAS